MQRIQFRQEAALRAAVIGLAAAFLTSCSMGRHHSVLIKGAPIAYVEKGTGLPTVVFEAGLGDGLASWEPIFEDVSEFTMAVAYSRAGYAGNIYHIDKGGRRSADDVAHMLKALLEKRKIPGPYLLVGHSIGGNYALRFAKLFPQDVVGIVLIDSRPRGFTKECEKARLRQCGPSELHALAAPAHVAAEIRGLEESEEETPAPEELGDLPVTVIAATKPPKLAPRGIQDIWLRMQSEFARQLKNGLYVQADGSRHYIHRDAPNLVVREIRSQVEVARSREFERSISP